MFTFVFQNSRLLLFVPIALGLLAADLNSLLNSAGPLRIMGSLAASKPRSSRLSNLQWRSRINAWPRRPRVSGFYLRQEGPGESRSSSKELDNVALRRKLSTQVTPRMCEAHTYGGSSRLPKSLKSVAAREARRDLLRQPHVAPLADYVRQMRPDTGFGERIPFFDPLDGV